MSKAQEAMLPVDLRQHNLTQFNSSLFNPVYSLDRNRPQSLALWTRWQWQSIDGDPTTIFLNFTRQLNSKSAVGGGFFQHNTGTFLNTGGVLNYAYSFNLGASTKLVVGLNVFGFQQELADDRFQQDLPIPLPELQATNDFILQFAPGIRLMTNGFGIGFASENLFDYNFKNNESQTRSSEKIYIGMASYDIPLHLGNMENTILQPNLYIKSIPNGDTQYGFTTLMSTSKFWAQSGYNSFYGISFGAGGRFFQKISLGALMEFGTSNSLKDSDPSFELIAAYNFGTQHLKEKNLAIDEDENKDLSLKEEANKAKEEKTKEELAKAEALTAKKEAKKQADLQEKQRKEALKDSLDRAKKEQALVISEKLREQKRLDSINKAKAKEAIVSNQKLLEEKRLDSIKTVKLAEAETALKKELADKLAEDKKKEQPKTEGRYEEVANEDGLSPGYYLVANVFGTKKYFEGFMATLKTRGLNPKSFYRSLNKYNYVYLERYNTLEEAETARDNQFNGKYADKTWIFRVVGE